MASSASSARHPALSASWTMRSRHRSDTTSSSSDSDSSGQSQDLAGRPVTKTTDQVPDLTDYGAVPTFTPPTFTMKELFEVIPRHCFERSLLRSTRYLAQDIGMAAALMLAATYIDRAFGINGLILTETYGRVAQVVAWMLYWYFAGLVWTGVFVLGHECGHGAFAESKLANWTVGWIIHSALLVPYGAWKLSHQQHHAGIGHMSRDQTFVPKTRSQLGLASLTTDLDRDEIDGAKPKSFYDRVDDLLEDAPLWSFGNLFLQQIFGWPLYLLMNASGQESYPKWTNHFNPTSILFKPQHRRDIMLSNLGVTLALLALGLAVRRFGAYEVFRFYGIPYLGVNHWLVLVTFLQHTDASLPHYRGGSYSFQRGALCTMDRQIHGWFFHGIAEHHTAHHLFARIPFYNCNEATDALKTKLGSHYSSTDENYWVSLWKTYRHCRFVEDEGEVVFYKNAKGQAKRRPALAVLQSCPTQVQDR